MSLKRKGECKNCIVKHCLSSDRGLACTMYRNEKQNKVNRVGDCDCTSGNNIPSISHQP